jgi:hypothetical protein
LEKWLLHRPEFRLKEKKGKKERKRDEKRKQKKMAQGEG